MTKKSPRSMIGGGSEDIPEFKQIPPGVELDVPVPDINADKLEQRYLYPEKVIPPRLNKAEITKMGDDFYADPRPMAQKLDGVVQEAVDTSPYREKPWDIGAEWLSDISYLVAQELGIHDLDEETAKNLLMAVPCVGRKADMICGTDCMLIYTNPRSKRKTVASLDLTTDPDRKLDKGFKADIVVTHFNAILHKEFRPRGAELGADQDGIIHEPKWRQRRVAIAKAIAGIIRIKEKERKAPLRITKDFKETTSVYRSQFAGRMRVPFKNQY